MTQPDPGAAETQVDQHVCQFPVAFDPSTGEFEVAGHPIPEGPTRRGRKSDYCGELVFDPDGTRRRHDRATAFQRRRELQLEAAGQAPRKPGPEPAPVTSARASLRELLAQIQMATTAHRTQMGEMLDKVADIVATAGDPDAAVAEVARIRTEVRAEVEAAQARAAEAEADAITARRERDRAAEDKVLAEGAAEDALAERDQARAEAEQAERDAEQARTDADTAIAKARERIAQVERDAGEQIATIRAEAADRIARVEEDAQARIDHANELVRLATEEKNQAISERAGAEQAAGDARTEAERLRRELAEAQATHRDELTQWRRDIAAVRTEAREDREQLRSDHAAETARIQESAAAQVGALRQALSTAESTIARLESEISRQKGER
ncbi:hypothetical protein [Nocardia testacea]|uniref:hypothetical protein n=1 Tax=Nocardia testacea TaxID=248551 RepID=UPI003A83F15D